MKVVRFWYTKDLKYVVCSHLDSVNFIRKGRSVRYRYLVNSFNDSLTILFSANSLGITVFSSVLT